MKAVSETKIGPCHFDGFVKVQGTDRGFPKQYDHFLPYVWWRPAVSFPYSVRDPKLACFLAGLTATQPGVAAAAPRAEIRSSGSGSRLHLTAALRDSEKQVLCSLSD